MKQEINEAYKNLSEVEYRYGVIVDELKGAQNLYNNALMNECIENILKAQEEDGKLTQRDLRIFISDLMTKMKTR